MKTIIERAKECFPDPWDADCILPAREGYIVEQQRQGYILGANEQKAIDIDKACEWLRIKKDWDEGCLKVFRIMMEE